MLMLTEESPSFHDLDSGPASRRVPRGCDGPAGSRSADRSFDLQRMADHGERRAEDLEKLTAYLFHRL